MKKLGLGNASYAIRNRDYTISKNDCLLYGCYACLEIQHKLEVYATLKRHYILEMVRMNSFVERSANTLQTHVRLSD